MLKDFFKLDGAFLKYQESEMMRHFKTASTLENVLYEPEKWPELLRRNFRLSFKNVSLAKTSFFAVTFRDCVFEDCLFIGAEFHSVEFHNCKFIDCNFYKSKFLDCYLDPKSIKFSNIYKKKYSNIGVALFQSLLENSAKQRQPFFEIDSDIRFRQWKRAQLLYDLSSKKIHRLTFLVSYVRSLAYEYICGFGYRPVRFALWTVGLFCVVAAANIGIFRSGLTLSGELILTPDFIDSVYFTFSILTVLGFSSIVPVTSFAKVVTVLEALVGVGWMGIFTSVLVKRFLK